MLNPEDFLKQTTTEVNEKRPPIPTENPDDPDGLYIAVIGEIKMESGTIGKGERTGQEWIGAVIPLKLQLPAQVQALGLPAEFQLTDRAFLDLTPQGGIDNGKGKNRKQREYREATGTNTAGVPWGWPMLSGKMVKVKIKHELYNETLQEKPVAVLKM